MNPSKEQMERTSNPMGLLNNQRTECTDRQLQCIRLNVIKLLSV